MTQETPATKNETPKRSKGYKWLIVLAVVAVGGAYGFSILRVKSTVRITDEKYDVLDARLQNLENTTSLHGDRLAKLERQAESAPVAVAPVAPVGDVADGAKKAPAPVASAPADNKRMEALEKEIDALKTAAKTAPAQNSEQVSHSIKMFSALHRLSDKVLSGKPYADALSNFEGVAGNDPELTKLYAALSEYAENGMPTQIELMGAFDQGMDKLTSAQAVPPAEAGAWDRLVFNLTHLVKIQRIDQAQAGKTTNAIVGRASAFLEAGDIENAYKEIDALPEGERANFTTWLEDAKTAMDVPGIVEQLEEHVMHKVFEPTPAPATAPAPAGKPKPEAAPSTDEDTL